MVTANRVRIKNSSRKKKKAIICTVCACVLAISGVFVLNYARAAAENVRSAAITLDADTGNVLNGENIHARLPMASTTKIMTAYLAVTSGRLNETVTIPACAVNVEGSSIYLKEGERYALIDLVYGLMLRSGNDAAVAIATYLAGSVDKFADMMNNKIAEWGLADTHFVNPHGLHDDSHYTSAYDLAMITMYAMQNKVFVKISSSKSHRFTGEDGMTRVFVNKNKMLSMCSGCIGVKTGYTKKAGRCLVSAVDRNGLRMISVVLNHGDMWNDSIANFDRAEAKCHSVTFVRGGEVIDTVINDVGQNINAGVREDIVLHLLPDRQYNLHYWIKYNPSALNIPNNKEKIGDLMIFDGKCLLFVANIYMISNEN